MHEQDASEEWPLFCDRCSRRLERGTGDFFVVEIQAFRDPTPPEFTEEDLRRDPKAEIRRLLDELADLSSREALEQVYRRLTLTLCTPCYQVWIENPTG